VQSLGQIPRVSVPLGPAALRQALNGCLAAPCLIRAKQWHIARASDHTDRYPVPDSLKDRTVMRTLSLLTSLALVSLTAQDCTAQHDIDWAKLKPAAAREAVAKTFESQCASCHLPPDMRFATDKAWLSQIMDTA